MEMDSWFTSVPISFPVSFSARSSKKKQSEKTHERGDEPPPRQVTTTATGRLGAVRVLRLVSSSQWENGTG